MTLIEEFSKAFDDLKEKMDKNENSRYLSWEYCYREFYNAFDNLGKIDKDYYLKLSLHLAFYLASWGMYRGSSFLLQFDYKIHLETVKLILEEKYKPLRGYKWVDKNQNNENNLCLLFDENYGLVNLIKQKYKKYRDNKVQQDISDILVTKILLGTLGCVPAYDEMLKCALKFGKNECKEMNLTQKFNKKSFEALVDFYSKNEKKLEKKRDNLVLKESPNIEYPQMKLLDMGFWQLGLKILIKEKN